VRSNNRKEAALDYIASMVSELKTIAAANEFETLAYLLGMASMEAVQLQAAGGAKARGRAGATPLPHAVSPRVSPGPAVPASAANE